MENEGYLLAMCFSASRSKLEPATGCLASAPAPHAPLSAIATAPGRTMLALRIGPASRRESFESKSANRCNGRHGMKGATEVARPAGRASRPGIRLTAQDMAQVRTIAATLRKSFGRKPPVLGGRNAAAAAPAIAGELGLDLFKIDLCAVTSKFIGETEKNLARIFDATEASGAILLFDKADALFGQRTGVKDAHDRYSNAEINSLLRGLERGHGLVFLVSKIPMGRALNWRSPIQLH